MFLPWTGMRGHTRTKDLKWLAVMLVLALQLGTSSVADGRRALAGDTLFDSGVVDSSQAQRLPLSKSKWKVPIYCAGDLINAVNANSVYQVVVNVAQGADNITDGYLAAQGSALAEATAGTVDGQYAVAVAYAAALCEQGETAQAFSQAFTVAVFCQQSTGCQVLAAANSLAISKCSAIAGQVSSYSYASTSAFAALIGHCKLAEPNVASAFKAFDVPAELNNTITTDQLRKWLPKGTKNICRKVCKP